MHVRIFTGVRRSESIGCPPLAADDPLLLHMMRGMALSAKNVGVHYNVVGIPDFNCC